MTTNGQPAGQLRRSLGVGDTVVIGLSSMIGAGIFAALLARLALVRLALPRG